MKVIALEDYGLSLFEYNEGWKKLAHDFDAIGKKDSILIYQSESEQNTSTLYQDLYETQKTGTVLFENIFLDLIKINEVFKKICAKENRIIYFTESDIVDLALCFALCTEKMVFTDPQLKIGLHKFSQHFFPPFFPFVDFLRQFKPKEIHHSDGLLYNCTEDSIFQRSRDIHLVPQAKLEDILYANDFLTKSRKKETTPDDSLSIQIDWQKLEKKLSIFEEKHNLQRMHTGSFWEALQSKKVLQPDEYHTDWISHLFLYFFSRYIFRAKVKTDFLSSTPNFRSQSQLTQSAVCIYLNIFYMPLSLIRILIENFSYLGLYSEEPEGLEHTLQLFVAQYGDHENLIDQLDKKLFFFPYPPQKVTRLSITDANPFYLEVSKNQQSRRFYRVPKTWDDKVILEVGTLSNEEDSFDHALPKISHFYFPIHNTPEGGCLSFLILDLFLYEAKRISQLGKKRIELTLDRLEQKHWHVLFSDGFWNRYLRFRQFFQNPIYQKIPAASKLNFKLENCHKLSSLNNEQVHTHENSKIPAKLGLHFLCLGSLLKRWMKTQDFFETENELDFFIMLNLGFPSHFKSIHEFEFDKGDKFIDAYVQTYFLECTEALGMDA